MDNALERRLWEIARCYMGDDLAHGIDHIREVMRWIDAYLADNPGIAVDIKNGLRAAGILHDIGRSRPGHPNGHATASVEILKEMCAQGQLVLPDSELVFSVIADHSAGLGGKRPTNNQEICLGLLVVFDHLDSLGRRGFLRHFHAVGEGAKSVPRDQDSIDIIVRCLERPWEVSTEQAFIRGGSFAGDRAYNYAAVWHIVCPVKDLLAECLLQEIRRRKEQTRIHVLGLLSGVTSKKIYEEILAES